MTNKRKKDKVEEGEERGEATPRAARNWRVEYLIAFFIMFFFEQFMFHEWRIYEYYQQRDLDIGVYEKSNIPITAHNMKLYLLYRTEMNISDFGRFVEVDVHDTIRDRKPLDDDDK